MHGRHLQKRLWMPKWTLGKSRKLRNFFVFFLFLFRRFRFGKKKHFLFRFVGLVVKSDILGEFAVKCATLLDGSRCKFVKKTAIFPDKSFLFFEVHVSQCDVAEPQSNLNL